MTRGTWRDPRTAQAYSEFERRHARYRRANAALARHAALAPGQRVLDLAAGTGGTTAALLRRLGPDAHIDCVEPSPVMAAEGRTRFASDARVQWHRSLRELGGDARFDRIVCGAAIWQWPDVPALLRRLSRRLQPGGALVFNIPAAYLGEPDGPGGGSDPYLTALLATALHRHPAATRAATARKLPTAAALDAALRTAGLVPQRWRHRGRLTQAAWRDWLCLPVLHAHLWPGVETQTCQQRIRDAAKEVDPNAWRPEHWLGWTAWRPAFACRPLDDASPLLAHPARLQRRARRDGAILLRGLLPVQQIGALRALLVRCGQAEGLLDARGRWTGGRATAPHEIPRWIALQQAMGSTPPFQRLVDAPPLTAAVAAVTGGPVRSGLGSVCRIAPPHHLVPATPPHRDAEFLRDGRDVWSAWLPLTRCGIEDGVLAVALRSHRHVAPPAWAAAEMAPGDALLFHADTLHRGCPNLRLAIPRLSIDLRFGPAV